MGERLNRRLYATQTVASSNGYSIVVCRHISLVRKVSNDMGRVRLLEFSGQRVGINPTNFTPYHDPAQQGVK